MRIGIMQPYYFPYIGFWQLMSAVDRYVVYDDVNFIKGGWINRNRILLNSEVKYFNLKLQGASPNKFINEVAIADDAVYVSKQIKTLESAYKKAPYYSEAMAIIEKVLLSEERNLALYLFNHIKTICSHLGITTEIIFSSQVEKNPSLNGQDKIVDICKVLSGTEYYNAIGGRELYSAEEFERNGLELKFLKTNDISYKQFNDVFEPNLSIIDMLMFNTVEDMRLALGEYELI